MDLVTPIPCLSDNYAYALVCPETGACAVVDPSESTPVADALDAAGLRPVAILCTHHHPDHVGGVLGLRARYGEGLAVYGHESETERIPALSHPLAHGARFALGNLALGALHIPGHTTGAIAFVVEGRDAVFTGDTLFVAGCGRLFEGTPAMMHRSLNATLAALPDATRMYPGHEYAEKNLRFAATVEPRNAAVRDKLARVTAARARDEACVPSTLGEERATNPFLRVTAPEVRAFARGRGADPDDPVAVLAAVREARNGF